jgi:hypothetical protein
MQTPKHTAAKVALTVILLGTAATGVRTQMMDGSDMMGKATSAVNSWPVDSQKAAKKVIAKYGAPHEATASMLVWHNNGPWKRTVASRTSTPHMFPSPHPDSVEQVISYRVPLDKYDDLARYDGSVTVDRTKGELAARCDLEEMNLLALNLAHDIITSRRSVAGARGFYARVVKMYKAEKKVHPYQMRLMFQPHTMSMGSDPDKISRVLKPMVRRMKMMRKQKMMSMR